VAKWYEYGLNRFWRHLAAEATFRKMEDQWFLEIVPKYFFTIDGEIPCDSEFVGPYTTSLKAQEYNNHVLNHVLFWSDVLSQRRDAIRLNLFGHTIMVIQKRPLFLVAPFAIPDDPATFEEKPPPKTRRFSSCTEPMKRMTMVNLRVEYLLEPKLQFGAFFEHEDSKTGLAEYGAVRKECLRPSPFRDPPRFCWHPRND